MMLTAGVVAHRQRMERALELADEVGADVVNVDDGTLGCEGNHLQVLKELTEIEPDWAVVLEDDAQPVPDFHDQLRAALEHTPAHIVSLYLGTGNPSYQVQTQIGIAVRAAQELHRSWVLGDCLIGSVGYAVSGWLAQAMLPGIVERTGELPLRISRWAQQWEFKVAYTMPSLVEHADGTPIGYSEQEMANLRAAKVVGSQRRAWSYGTPARWDTPVVELGYCPGWSSPR
jgi:hypothetical protein